MDGRVSNVKEKKQLSVISKRCLKWNFCNKYYQTGQHTIIIFFSQFIALNKQLTPEDKIYK